MRLLSRLQHAYNILNPQKLVNIFYIFDQSKTFSFTKSWSYIQKQAGAIRLPSETMYADSRQLMRGAENDPCMQRKKQGNTKYAKNRGDFSQYLHFHYQEEFCMHEMRQNFLKCGMTGWCMEVIFTGLHSIAKHDPKMMGQTSILMFPIYGAAALLGPISRLLKKHSILFRGLIYTCCIFTTEYVSGSILKKKKCVPGITAAPNGTSTV